MVSDLDFSCNRHLLQLYNFFTDMLKNVNIYASKDPFEDKTLRKSNQILFQY